MAALPDRLPNRSEARVLYIASLAAIVLIGALFIPFPFYNDQATFTMGASMLQHGKVMYVDFWDIKQPGIYFFYLLAGSMFGFHEAGIHVFEILYWVAFATVLLATLQREFSNRWVTATVPLLTVGMYYGSARAWHLTQVESLAGFPLYVALWSAVTAGQTNRAQQMLLLLSGFAAGIALVFKVLFFPIVVAFWLIAFWPQARARPVSILDIAWLGAGLVMPLFGATLYFAMHRALDALWITSFVIPYRVLMELPRQDTHELVRSTHWFVGHFWPVMLLSLAGAMLRPSWGSGRLRGGLAAWIAVGLAVILAQVQSWWEYHFMLLFVPLGVLAAYGLDALFDRVKRLDRQQASLARVAFCAILVMVFFSPALKLAETARLVERNRFATDPRGQQAIFSAENPEYAEVWRDSTFLHARSSLPGDVFVVGNETLHYYLTGRHPAVAVFFVPTSLLLDQREDIARRMQATRPSYVYIATQYASVVQHGYAQLSRYLRGHYTVQDSDWAGTWYRRVD